MAVALDGDVVERRGAPRHPRRALRWLAAARLWPGRRVRVIDWSSSGVLIEAGVRFAPGRTVTLQFLAERGHLLVRGDIVRAAVAAIGPSGLRYRAAVAFDKPTDFSRPREAPHRPGDTSARGRADG